MNNNKELANADLHELWVAHRKEAIREAFLQEIEGINNSTWFVFRNPTNTRGEIFLETWQWTGQKDDWLNTARYWAVLFCEGGIKVRPITEHEIDLLDARMGLGTWDKVGEKLPEPNPKDYQFIKTP